MNKKFFLHKTYDLSLNPGTYINKMDAVGHICHPSPPTVGWHITPMLTGQLACSMQCSNRKETCLFKVEGEILLSKTYSLTFTHTPWHTLAYTHIPIPHTNTICKYVIIMIYNFLFCFILRHGLSIVVQAAL